MDPIHDRLRIPWIEAKQVTFDSILPVFILPLMFLLASINLWCTVFSFTCVAIFLFLLFMFFTKKVPKTKFFLAWTLTSIVLLYFIFEFIVIPFLEILLEENVALSILIFGFVICLYLMKYKAKQITDTESEYETSFLGKNIVGFYMCRVCDTKIPDKDHHCVWFDCCISKHNQCFFILTLLFGTAALLYSSNLTLTSVCHPFEFYKTVLLPDDCSDVYFKFELGLSFVSAIYSVFLAVVMLMLFLQQVLLVSIGIPLKDWNKMSIFSKLCLGLNKTRPHNRGFLKNWADIICCTTIYRPLPNREV